MNTKTFKSHKNIYNICFISLSFGFDHEDIIQIWLFIEKLQVVSLIVEVLEEVDHVHQVVKSHLLAILTSMLIPSREYLIVNSIKLSVLDLTFDSFTNKIVSIRCPHFSTFWHKIKRKIGRTDRQTIHCTGNWIGYWKLTLKLRNFLNGINPLCILSYLVYQDENLKVGQPTV